MLLLLRQAPTHSESCWGRERCRPIPFSDGASCERPIAEVRLDVAPPAAAVGDSKGASPPPGERLSGSGWSRWTLVQRVNFNGAERAGISIVLNRDGAGQAPSRRADDPTLRRCRVAEPLRRQRSVTPLLVLEDREDRRRHGYGNTSDAAYLPVLRGALQCKRGPASCAFSATVFKFPISRPILSELA